MSTQTVTVTPTGTPSWRRGGSLDWYGSSSTKTESDTEGIEPYAWTWYTTFGAMLGSWATAATGNVHAIKLALSRMFCGVTRANERLQTNALPGTADEALSAWVDALGIRIQAADTRYSLRAKCAAKFQLALGPTQAVIDSAAQGLCGEAWVRSWRQLGAGIDTPPTVTYWPGVNPGPASYDLGGGTWLSERAHYVVEVQIPGSWTVQQFLERMNVDLFDLLNRMMPATETFDWAVGPLSAGFILDVSQLDFNGLTP